MDDNENAVRRSERGTNDQQRERKRERERRRNSLERLHRSAEFFVELVQVPRVRVELDDTEECRRRLVE